MLAASLGEMIKINSLPYSEYWLPLLIGLGIGGMFLVVAKTVFGRTAPPPPPPLNKHNDYDPFSQGSPTENRKSFRRTGHPVEVRYNLADDDIDKQPARSGWVFDRSVGGLGLVATEAYTAGTVLVVRPVHGNELLYGVEVQVRSCRPAESGGFELGCQFVKTPPWSVLLLFG